VSSFWSGRSCPDGQAEKQRLRVYYIGRGHGAITDRPVLVLHYNFRGALLRKNFGVRKGTSRERPVLRVARERGTKDRVLRKRVKGPSPERVGRACSFGVLAFLRSEPRRDSEGTRVRAKRTRIRSEPPAARRRKTVSMYGEEWSVRKFETQHASDGCLGIGTILDANQGETPWGVS
jgi:hypothetical protein